MDRRRFLSSVSVGAAATAMSLVAADTAAAAPGSASAPPTFPFEVSRTTALTDDGIVYDNILVDLAGDLLRLFVPRSAQPGQDDSLGAVWFYHGAGGSQDAINWGLRYPAELVVSAGAIAACFNAGGVLYSNEQAQEAQENAWRFVSHFYSVRMNFLRATSAGGALSSYSLGHDLLPYTRGLYLVNGVYDVEWVARRDALGAASVAVAFDYNPAKVAQFNPARTPGGLWTGKRARIVVSDDAHPDLSVDPEFNGLAFARDLRPVASDVSVAFHGLGHTTPAWTHRDMLDTFQSWARATD